SPFDAFFCDLRKTPAFKIPELLGRTTWLVFEKGSFLSLKGRAFVQPKDDLKKTFEEMVKRLDASICADQFDAVLSLVSAFPIPTSEGPLKKRAFRGFLKRAKKRLTPGALFEKRVFERLDDNRVVCMEEWPTEDPSAPFSRWLFFKKTGADWKLEMVFLGQGRAAISHNPVDTG
ncbi:MAG: hypothetical protein AB1558_04900, partial [Thermodesulfobacteriota bacterium]